jgi:uncharacterized protein YbjT (DUF2867 family)
MSARTKTTLVLGGTGKTGRRVVERLTRRGLPVRTGSRRGSPPFDWDDPGTWDAALREVGAVYLAYAPDVAAPGAAAAVGRLARRAVEAGARRLVLLSGRNEEEAVAAEVAVRESGAEVTILRCAFFDQNFSEGLFADDVRGGAFAFMGGRVGEPFLDAGDVADVAVAALTAEGHAGRTYELTGPDLLTFADAARIIGEAAGRPIRYTAVSKEEYAAALEQFVPAADARFLADLFARVLDGRNAHVTDDVARVLGRPARRFAEYAREAAAAGAWSP